MPTFVGFGVAVKELMKGTRFTVRDRVAEVDDGIESLT
jgi:hypothetical protein